LHLLCLQCDSVLHPASYPAEEEEDEQPAAPCVEVADGEVHIERLSPSQECRVLGSQANLWTEYVPDEATAEYMLLPRLCAMAEVLW
jgi:hexosaminidase